MNSNPDLNPGTEPDQLPSRGELIQEPKAFDWLSAGQFALSLLASGLLLGAFLVILWPAFDALSAALLKRSVDQVMEGQTPSIFPFSVMVRGDAGWTGWQMPVGEFVTKFHFAKLLLKYLILAILIALLARSLKKLKQTAAGSAPRPEEPIAAPRGRALQQA